MNFNLNTAKALLGAAVVAGTLTAVSQPASAISFTTTAGQSSTFGGVTTVGFEGVRVPIDSSVPTGGYTENGITFTGGSIARGNSANQFRAPGTDSGSPDFTNYLTLGGNAPSPVTIALGGLKGYFGLFVGSIDSYNSIEFFKGLGSVGSFTGTDIAVALGLSPKDGNYGVDSYVNFFGDSNSDLFDSVKLSSSSAAFELDNIATREAIPTPALLPGLIGLGVAALRKRKQNQQSEAEA